MKVDMLLNKWTWYILDKFLCGKSLKRPCSSFLISSRKSCGILYSFLANMLYPGSLLLSLVNKSNQLATWVEICLVSIKIVCVFGDSLFWQIDKELLLVFPQPQHNLVLVFYPTKNVFYNFTGNFLFFIKRIQ